MKDQLPPNIINLKHLGLKISFILFLGISFYASKISNHNVPDQNLLQTVAFNAGNQEP